MDNKTVQTRGQGTLGKGGGQFISRFAIPHQQHAAQKELCGGCDLPLCLDKVAGPADHTRVIDGLRGGWGLDIGQGQDRRRLSVQGNQCDSYCK